MNGELPFGHRFSDISIIAAISHRRHACYHMPYYASVYDLFVMHVGPQASCLRYRFWPVCLGRVLAMDRSLNSVSFGLGCLYIGFVEMERAERENSTRTLT